MKPYKKVDAADIAFFEEIMPGRVSCYGENISVDYSEMKC